MTDDTIPAAEFDAILAQLEGAGLVEQYTNAEGEPAMRLTAKGERIANQAAMSSDDDAAALMDALPRSSRTREEARP
jgi:DNA-binding MarR family transcriptional regulator